MNKPELTYDKCSHCNGKGRIPGEGTGRLMRVERRGRGVNRPQLLAYFTKPEGGLYSESYIIDLETDRRPWTHDLVERYRKAIERAVEARTRTTEKELSHGIPQSTRS